MNELREQLLKPGTVLLDASASDDADGYLFVEPENELSAGTPSEVIQILELVDKALDEGYHVAGFQAYEAGYGFEEHRFSDMSDVDFTEQLGYPIVWFGLYRTPIRLKSLEVAEALSGLPRIDLDAEPALTETETDYQKKVDTIRTLIRDGDVYQINLTGRFEADTAMDGLDLYALMRSRQPVSYGAFINLGSVQLLSASPERFIEWRGSVIRAQPMKGTVARGETPEVNELLSAWLKTDPKNRAENLMIVDLLRNDLSVVCEPGSVVVPSLFDIESYSTVLQMTSTVTGTIAPSEKASDLMAALFPCGSVTGAPKIRAMRRILELESRPRGVYCGAIGHFTPDGHGIFNVAIRTLSLKEGHLVLGSGGGIVWDSQSADEHQEAVLKTKFLSAGPKVDPYPLRIFETMKWSDGIEHLDHHLARMERAANTLGYPYPFRDIINRLEQLDRASATGASFIVRLLLDAAGHTEIETRPIQPPSFGAMRIGIAERKVFSGNPFLYVKTTFRPDYDIGQAEAQARGLDEVLFLNEREEITEGTITNVFLLLDGRWVTPPASSGLLAGVGRMIELASERSPKEQVISIRDYERAEEIVLTNAVRGRMKAVRA